MRPKHLFLSLALLAAGCGGGGGSASPLPTTAFVSPNPSVTFAPSPLPSAPITVATSTPTIVPLAQRQIGGAPVTATASQLSRIRTQSIAQANPTATGLPVLVESSGMVATWAGDVGVWTTNIADAKDIAQTGLTVTPSGNLPINNPGPTPLSCLGSVAAMCVVHPTAWQFGTSSANGKPIGKQTLTVAFADGTTGTMPDYVFNGWQLACNGGVTYVGGIPIAQGTAATADWYADCTNLVINFPHGAQAIGAPTLDGFNRYEPFLTTILSATISAPVTSVPIVNPACVTNCSAGTILQGQVYAVKLGDGGIAKVFFGSAPGIATNAVSGMSLHDAPSGSGTFAF